MLTVPERGVLYVVVAVLVGTFFVAAVYFADSAESWAREGLWVSGFLRTYALALAGGFGIQIVAAVCLRWLTRVFGLDGLVHWIGFGAALGFALPWALARLGYLIETAHFPREWQTVKLVVMFPLMGAMMYDVQPGWVMAAVGAATGGTLRLIVRRRQT